MTDYSVDLCICVFRLQTLITAIGKSLNSVAPEGAHGWFAPDEYGTGKCITL
ncbi:MAG: hypothetical protein ABGX16_16820 [Pirellulales bacterium]